MNKQKAKKALFALSNEDEKFELLEEDLRSLNAHYDNFGTHMKDVLAAVNKLKDTLGDTAKTREMSEMMVALATGLRSLNGAYVKEAKGTTAAFKEMQSEFLKALGELKTTVSTHDTGASSVPLYKAMINAISGVETTIKNKPNPVWNWPQYASVGVRNRSFSNVDPSVDSMCIGEYDYVSNDSETTSDTYRFYQGGSGGKNTATVVIAYTDSTKVVISTVTKTPQVLI